jgi:hypothetical protein
MKKRELSPIELKKVVELRQVGAKWTEIEQETKVERRAARRAYEEWERDKKMKEQEAARFRVAAEAYHEHLDDLIRLAGSLLTNLGVPSSLSDMQKNAEQFFSWLFEQDLLQRYISPQVQTDVYTMGATQPFHIGGPQFYPRVKELLFESLKVHTREEIRWEEVLDNRWKEARNNCAKIVPELRRETSEVVKSFLNQEQEREMNFLQKVKEGSREDDPAKRIVEVVLRKIWRAILGDRLEEEGHWFQTVSRRMGPPEDWDIIVESSHEHEKVLTFIGNTNESLAEKVTGICNLAANNLGKGDMVRQLHDEVGTMEKATEELREMLNPVKLTPMILRTRCDLCPA